jgi:hypothetical protein
MGQASAASSADPQNDRVRAQLVKAAATVVAILKGDNDTTRTQRDALIAFTVRVASAGLLYLSQIVLARWMGRFEYGIRLDLVADARRARASGL